MRRPNEAAVRAAASALTLDTDAQRNQAAYIHLVHAMEDIAFGWSVAGRIRNRAQYAADTLKELAERIPPEARNG